jgi:peroxiredoxin Q/BCP
MSRFRDDLAKFTHKGVEVFGVSPDGVERLRDFARELKLPFKLLSDADKKAADAYGVAGLFIARSVFLLRDGKIVYANGAFKIGKSEEELYAAIDALP